MARPTATKLQLQSDPSSSAFAEFSISAWFPTDAMSRNPSSTEKHTPEQHTPSLRAPHESLYTITVVPSSLANPQDSIFGAGTSPAHILMEQAFQEMDVAVVVISKDGQTQIQNRACEEVIGYDQRNYTDDEEAKDMNILTWANTRLTLFNETFSRPFENEEWPIFTCAFLGQSSPPAIFGIELESGDRRLLHCAAKALRNSNGHGEHIGGVAIVRDITAEQEKKKKDEELQSTLHYRQVVDNNPQLHFQADSSGFFNWYSSSFYKYTGVTEEVCISYPRSNFMLTFESSL
jgi:PAS domain-containing protein